MDESLSGGAAGNAPVRSQHYLSRNELLSGLANRFVFSSFYIWLYLSLAILSFTTVILSLLSDCPTLAFYLLELVINLAMIVEVCIRFVAFGRKFWASVFNIVDLILMIFCIVTVLVIFFSGCSAKGEEVFDTFLLVIRNLIQFFRLAIVLRRSGRSIFTRIPAIDLSTAADAAYTLDFDLDDEEAELEDRRAAGGDLSALRSKRANLNASTATTGSARASMDASANHSRLASRTATPTPGQNGPSAAAAQPFLLADDEEDDDDSFLDSGRNSRPT